MRATPFITFEGVDGTGKTTLLKAIQAHLESYGANVLVTREPGNSLGGDAIRELMFGSKVGLSRMLPGQVDCLMLYDHIGNAEGIVRPALAAGMWVLCDRYADSQFAYTSVRPNTEAINIAYRANYGPVPDITFLLIGNVEEFTRRAKSRDDAPDALEPGKQDKKTWNRIEQQEQVQQAYFNQLAHQDRTIVLDITGKNAEEVAALAIGQLQMRLRFNPAAQAA